MSLLARFSGWLVRRRRGRLQVYADEQSYLIRLKCIWDSVEQPPTIHESPQNAELHPSESEDVWHRKIVTIAANLDWKIAFTSAFSKAISVADRSMQGRVLIALSELSSDPATPRGDTVKPLIGDKQGLWRYRLGDYRLVYEPRLSDRMVVLIDFAARGGVYG